MSGVVAIVDDYVPLLDSLRHLLEADGHAVRTYASPASFLADRGNAPACLIVDYNMPGMTGLRACRAAAPGRQRNSRSADDRNAVSSRGKMRGPGR